MRIVAGVARGRRLASPAAGTRPTSDRVREALFNSIESRLGALGGLRVLDLYAGSGAVGLEALSRGAAHVLLVEKDRAALEVVRANIAAVRLDGAVVVSGDVTSLTSHAPPTQAAAPYDVVVADPPYSLDDVVVEGVLQGLATHGWLDEGSLVAQLLSESDKFFEDVEVACDQLSEQPGKSRFGAQENAAKRERKWTELRIRKPELVQDNVTLPIQRLREAVSDLIKTSEDKEIGQELLECNRRLGELKLEVAEFLSQQADDHVYWVERAGKTQRNISLNRTRVAVKAGDSIDEFLDDFPSVARAQVIQFLEDAREQLIAAAT